MKCHKVSKLLLCSGIFGQFCLEHTVISRWWGNSVSKQMNRKDVNVRMSQGGQLEGRKGTFLPLLVRPVKTEIPRFTWCNIRYAQCIGKKHGHSTVRQQMLWQTAFSWGCQKFMWHQSIPISPDVLLHEPDRHLQAGSLAGFFFEAPSKRESWLAWDPSRLQY